MLMMVVIILMFFNLLKSCYWSIFLRHYVQIIVGVWVVTLLELLVAIRCIG